MQSKAANVDEYLKEVPVDRLDALNKMRQLFLQELKGYKETLRYGGPCYEKNGIAEAGFASQKGYIGVYILKQDVFEKYKGEFKNVSMGKGVIRFSRPDKINFDAIKKLLAATYDSENTICG